MCTAVFQLLIHFPIAKWSDGAGVDIWLENTCMAGWFGHGWQETPPCFENFAWCTLFSCRYGELARSDLWTSGVKGETIYWSDFRIGLVSMGGVSTSLLADQRVSQELWNSTLLSKPILLTLRQDICHSTRNHYNSSTFLRNVTSPPAITRQSFGFPDKYELGCWEMSSGYLKMLGIFFSACEDESALLTLLYLGDTFTYFPTSIFFPIFWEKKKEISRDLEFSN